MSICRLATVHSLFISRSLLTSDMSLEEDNSALLHSDITCIPLEVPSLNVAGTSKDICATGHNKLSSPPSTNYEQHDGVVESHHDHLAFDLHAENDLDKGESDFDVDESVSEIDRIRLHFDRKLCFMRRATSFDGLKFMHGKPIRKAVWIAIFFLSMLAMSLVMYIITDEYLARSTTFTRQIYVPQTLKFPAITICNHNPYYKISVGSGVYYSLPIEAQVAIRYENYKRDQLSEADRETILTMLDEQYGIYNTKFNQSVTLASILKQYGHKLHYGLTLCKFDGDRCGIDNFTELVTAYGLCSTFNLDSTNHVNGAGTSHSLFLMIDIQQYNYMYFTSHTAGLQVFIHSQDEYPYSGESHGFSVAPGFETQVAVSLTNTKLMEPPYGQCGNRPINDPYINPCQSSSLIEDNDKVNMMDCHLPIRRYTRQRCLDECEAIYQHKKCGCKADYLPGANISVCNLNKLFGCLLSITEQFSLIKNRVCDCPIECNQVHYSTELSQSYFPAKQYSVQLQRWRYGYTPYSQEDIRQNMLTLLIYYDSLEYTEVTEESDFDMFRYLADFGSNLGLFTGAGVLTFFELFEICLY